MDEVKPASDDQKSEGKARAAVLKRARERYKYVCDVDSKNRERQADDTRFVYVPGNQWPDKTRADRAAAQDPCMEFPQLKQFVNQVVNDQRQNRPGIRVFPANGEASEEVAEILQGLCRGIEYDSRAEAVYDGGYQASVVGGRGYWRIVSEYAGADSFEQKLVIKRIADPNTVKLDPDFQEPDGSDRRWGFVDMAIAKDEYKRLYPKAGELNYSEDTKLWKPDDKHVIVADYYEREAVKRVLAKLSDGSVIWKDRLPAEMPPDLTIVDEREADSYSVKWYTIGGGEEVLDEKDWPGTLIPVVCTMGDEIVVDGERMYQGLITQAKDTQTLFNFGMTQQAIHLSLTPRAPYVAAAGQIEKYKHIWADANNGNYSVLPYDPLDNNGHPVPPPQRQMPSTPDSGWINWTQQMTMLMRSCIGMYEASLAMRSPETSGRALMTKERQSDNATFHFADNLGRAIALTGRILIECIPTYYDTERIVHIIGPDDVRKLVKINEQSQVNPFEAIRRNDVTVGQYAVAVEAGPTYATKRQEKADLLATMVQAYPPLMQLAGDLVMKAQEMPDAEQFAERLKMGLPPQIQQMIQAEEQDGEMVIPPEVRQQMMQMQQALQQMQQQVEALTAQNAELQDDNRTTIIKAAMDNATKLLMDLNQPVPVASMDVAAGVPSFGGPVVAPPPMMAPRPDPMAVMAELPRVMEQIVAMGQQLAAAVTAPRQVSLQTDPAGNPVGAVSTVVQ